MEAHALDRVAAAIGFIEAHLGEGPLLEDVAHAACCSKYHLHRLFTRALGLSPHDYGLRRRMTEAARLLTCSPAPIADIAFESGFGGQAAFSTAFKDFYKLTPCQYRQRGSFYPLQLPLAPHPVAGRRRWDAGDIRMACEADTSAWMALVRATIDGYPCLDEAAYRRALRAAILRREAWLLTDGALAVGAMLFSREACHIGFWSVHPQYRDCGVERLFLSGLKTPPGHCLSITTYRAGDRADTGHRARLHALGFAERELLTEYGYPVQRFVLEDFSP